MGAYDFNFDLPAGETYAPSPERVRALQALLPRDPFGFAPPVTDRAAWSRWPDDPFGQRVLALARELAAAPFPDYTDEVYLETLAKEDVTRFNAAMPVVRQRQVTFLLAEAIYDTGEFLPVITSDTQRLAALRTWIHPGNDLQRLNYDGKTVEVDLASVHSAAHLAQLDFILGARLPADFRALIRAQVDQRLFTPLRQRIESGRDIYWWVNVKHNWNAVCLACTAEAAAALLPAADRAWWLAFAGSLVLNFRESFTDDGACTEGVGYWNYGFSHFIFLAELLRLGSGNAIDLLDEPKMQRAARFPDYAEIEPGVFPTYADSRLDARPVTWARYWLDNRRATPPAPVRPLPSDIDPFADMSLGSAAEALLWMFQSRDPRRPHHTALPPRLRHWFDAFQLLLCRPGPQTTRRFSATFLGGTNGRNHNHNDLGTFTVLLDGRALVVDPGAETYSFRTFSTHRYDSQLLNSYGHPVPRVAGQLQEAGAQWMTTVLAQEFSDDTDRLVLNLRNAYDVPGLRKLEREFLYDRRGAGSLTITDRVEFSTPSAFESALITFGDYRIDGSRIRLTDGPAALDIEVTLDGAPLEIATDVINQPPAPKRLALRCARDVRTATLRTVLRPA